MTRLLRTGCGVLLFALTWLGVWTPEVRAGHGDTHTPVGTVIKSDVAHIRFMRKLTQTGDSRIAYTDTVYDTVTLLSSVEVNANQETSYIGPTDTYVFVKHIRNLGNGYDTYRVRGDSTLNFVRGIFVDRDADSSQDATDPAAETIILKDIKETVVLVLVQRTSTGEDGAVDTLKLSATSTDTMPSAETVMLVLTLDSQPPTVPTLRTPSNGFETNSLKPLFTWDTSVDTASGLKHYRFQIDTIGLFTYPVIDSTLVDTKLIPTSNLAAGRYYWRVRAVDTVNNYSRSSPESSVLVIDTGATTVTLDAPAAGHETNAATIRFQWSSADADTFTWQLSKSSAFTTITDSVVDTTARSVSKKLPHEDTFYWRVIGRDTAANYDTTAGRIILLDTSVDQVSLSLPADGHETNVSRPIVSWNAVGDSVGIDSYVVEVSKLLTFASLVTSDTVDSSFTSDTIAGLYNDTYFWRVRAIDDLGNTGPVSAVRGFILDTAVSKVSLATPASGSTTTDSTPTLTWTAVSDSVGIDSYVLEVSVRTNFDTILFTDTVDAANTSDTTGSLSDSTYYWRIRAVDDLGNIGSNSDSFSFVLLAGPVTVTLVSPTSGHETTAAQFAFVWTSTGGETYTWQISKNSAFTTILDSTVDTSATRVVKLIPHQDTFFWRVIGRNQTGTTDTSSARGFVLDTSVETASLSTPAAGHDTKNSRPVVSWSAVADSVGMDSYAVEASKSSAFTSLIFADTVDAALTSDTITGLYNDTYFWRVRGIDDLGNAGVNSAARGFLIDTDAPQVTLSAPANGHETSNVKVVVTWTAATGDSSGIDSYAVEASKSSAFTSLVFADTVPAARTTDTITGLYNDTYFWRVRAVDVLGNIGAAATSRGFVVDTEVAQVTLTSPSNGAATQDTTPTFSWTAASGSDSTGIDSYVVQVARDSAFTILKFVDTIDAAATSDTAKAGIAEDTLYWRVIAIDNIGNTTASAIFSFIIDTTSPAIPTLLSPSYGHETTSVNPSFRWSTSQDSGSGLLGYRLELWRDSTLATLYRTDTFLVTSGGAFAAALDTSSSTLAPDTYYWRVVVFDIAGNTSVSTPPPRQIIVFDPHGSIGFDRSEYKGLRVSAEIRLTDPLANQQPSVIETADVTVFSDADPTGFTLTLTESADNSSVFVGTIQFTTGLTDASAKKIRVNPGSGVTAKRIQLDGNVLIASVRWLVESGAPPADVTKTRTWPNPVNPTTGQPIIFQNLPADPSMTIDIYTLDMKKVRNLYNGNGITASSFGNSAQWDGKNESGQYVASGVYLYIVRSQFGTTVKKITLVK